MAGGKHGRRVGAIRPALDLFYGVALSAPLWVMVWQAARRLL